MHDSILGHKILHSSATIYSLVHHRKCNHSFLSHGVVAFTHGILFSEDCISIGLTLLIIDGLLLDDDIQAQQHFT